MKRAYRTSVIPLWLLAKRRIAEVSQSSSYLADATIITGYSEGGYAAVSIASAISALGGDIVALQAGGGPYRMSSIQNVAFISKWRLRLFPLVSS